MKGPNISHPRRRMIRAILGRNVTTVWSSYLCPNGPYKSGPLFQKPPPRLFSSIDVRIRGGCSLVATMTATRCNSSNNIASPCARTSSNKLLCVCLLSGCRGGSAAGLYVLGIFVRSQPLAKACHRSCFLYYCCDLCLQSRGCPVASYDWAACACCLSQQLAPCCTVVRCFLHRAL